MRLPRRGPRPALWLACLVLLTCLAVPAWSHAIQSVSPNPVAASGTRAITVYFSPGEFDAGGNVIAFHFDTPGGGINDVQTVPQYVSSITLLVPVPSDAGAVGFVGPYWALDPFAPPGQNPFSTQSASFAIGPDDGEPDAELGEIVTDVSPRTIYRGLGSVEFRLTLENLPPLYYTIVGLQLFDSYSGGVLQDPIVSNAPYMGWDKSCDTSPCDLNLEIPSDAPLGPAYLRIHPSSNRVTVFPVTIADGVPNQITGITPDRGLVGSDITVTIHGSNLSDTLQARAWDTIPTPDEDGGWSYRHAVLALSWIDASTIQGTIPAAFAAEGKVVEIKFSDPAYGQWDGDFPTFPFYVLEPGSTDPDLAITGAYDSLMAGGCRQLYLDTTHGYDAWPEKFVAVKYATGERRLDGGSEYYVRTGVATLAVPVTAANFYEDPEFGSRWLEAQVCLPADAMPGSATAHVAPGGTVNGHPSAWVYLGADVDITAFRDVPTLAGVTPATIAVGSPDTRVTATGTHLKSIWGVWLVTELDGWEAADFGPVTWNADNSAIEFTVPGSLLATAQTLGVYLYNDTEFLEGQIVVTEAPVAGTPTLHTLILGEAVTAFTSYSSPVRVEIRAVDSPELALGTSSLTAAPETGPPITIPITDHAGTTYSAIAHLAAPGTYTIALTGETPTGQPVSATTTLALAVETLALSCDPLLQVGQRVHLPVQWPAVSGGLSDLIVDCGTTPAQTFSGSAGACVYEEAGSYAVRGRFTDALGATSLWTALLPVTIPALPPARAMLRVEQASGQAASHDLGGAVPVATIGTPTAYPMPVQLTLTLDPPVPGTPGIADRLDRPQSRTYVKPVGSAADLVADVSVNDEAVHLAPTADPTQFTVTTTLSRFEPDQDDPARWRQRFLLRGRTLHGDPIEAELLLQGPKNTAVQYDLQRIDPIYPYAPAVYRYRVTNLRGVPGEPMTQRWSAGESLSTREGDGTATVTFTGPGQHAVTFEAEGPLSRMAPASGATDPLLAPTVPTPPPGNPIAFVVSSPRYNRPPATYRFQPTYPPLLPGERLVGGPSWAVDNEVRSTGSVFYFTFDTAGAHEVVVSQPTSLRMLYGRMSVTVNANQPPTGGIDCSGSYLDKTAPSRPYVISCRAVSPKDTDGRISQMTWSLPDDGVPPTAGSTYFKRSLVTPPHVVPVRLVLTDDAGAATTAATTVDLATLR